MTLSEYLITCGLAPKAMEIDAGLPRGTVGLVAKGARPVSLRVALEMEIATGGLVAAESLLKNQRDQRVLKYLRGY